MSKNITKQKARKQYKCSKCGAVINVGDEYVKGTPFRRKPIIRCTNCGVKQFELSSSEYVQTVGQIVECWQDDYEIDADTVSSISSDLDELKDTLQDSLDNMPESLQYSETGELLQGRIDCIETTLQELESIDWDEIYSAEHDSAEQETPYDEDYYESEEQWEVEIDELAQQNAEDEFTSQLNDALSNLEY